MSKVVSLTTRQVTKQLAARCDGLRIIFTEVFYKKMCDESLSHQKRRRVANYFIKHTPGKLILSFQGKGYSKSDIFSTMFSQRFGKYLAIYRFVRLRGRVGIELLDLIKLIAEQLIAIATRFSYVAEGGETKFYTSFEVYYCDPVLCVDPIER